METKHFKILLTYAFEFMLVNFLILSLFELLKPNLVSGVVRMDWYFGLLIVFGGFELLINKTRNQENKKTHGIGTN